MDVKIDMTRREGKTEKAGAESIERLRAALLGVADNRMDDGLCWCGEVGPQLGPDNRYSVHSAECLAAKDALNVRDEKTKGESELGQLADQMLVVLLGLERELKKNQALERELSPKLREALFAVLRVAC